MEERRLARRIRPRATAERCARKKKESSSCFRVEVSRRVVAPHRAAAATHTCNRWKAGIEHLVYFPTSSIAPAEKNFIVGDLETARCACYDSIRNLKNGIRRVRYDLPNEIFRFTVSPMRGRVHRGDALSLSIARAHGILFLSLRSVASHSFPERTFNYICASGLSLTCRNTRLWANLARVPLD